MTGFVAWKVFLFISRNCTFENRGLEFLKRSTLLALTLRHPGFKIWYFSNGPGVWTWWHVIANNNTARAAADDCSSAVNDEILKSLLLIWIFRMFRGDASIFFRINTLLTGRKFYLIILFERKRRIFIKINWISPFLRLLSNESSCQPRHKCPDTQLILDPLNSTKQHQF